MTNKMRRYTDKYFLRSNEILKAEGLNPWVNMQVFVRKGPGKVAGIDEAIDLITTNSDIEKVGGRIYAKHDGQLYTSKETQMNIIAPIQSIVELETVYLGVIAAATTLANGGKAPDLKAIERNVAEVVGLAGGRPVFYFGARHWHYDMDADITAAAFRGGASSTSTDEGAAPQGQEGMGTIPHALENIYAFYHGKDQAVVRSTEAFDRVMSHDIPRVALVDYNNREISDSIATARSLQMQETGLCGVTRLSAVRVDTCGENVAEGGYDTQGARYWTGTGVTVTGVAALRQALDSLRLESRVGIVLSSGFGDTAKVAAFNEGERIFGMRLYDAIGAGFLDDVRTSTADIIAVGTTPDQVDFYAGNPEDRNIIHKVGRPPKPNYTLERIL